MFSVSFILERRRKILELLSTLVNYVGIKGKYEIKQIYLCKLVFIGKYYLDRGKMRS